MQKATSRGYVLLHDSDNVAVTTRFCEAGSVLHVQQRRIELTEPIAMGHKVAVHGVAKGQPVFKYGQVIGHATESIAPGQWVHSHNLALQDLQRDYASAMHTPPLPPPISDCTFRGYRRPDGQRRHPQLLGGDLYGQLFGFGQQVHCAAFC